MSFLLAQFILKVISINIGRRRKENKCNKNSFRKGIKRAPAREILLLKVIIILTFSFIIPNTDPSNLNL